MAQLPTLGDRKSHAFLMAALDSKQRMYIEARTLGSVPVAAARMAGYKKPDETALELERDTTVRTALEISIRLKAREHQVTRDDVLGMLQDAYRNAVTATEMVNAAKEIGRLLGHYEPQKIDIQKTVTLKQEQLKSLSDEDLLRLTKDAIDGDFELLDFEPEPAYAAP